MSAQAAGFDGRWVGAAVPRKEDRRMLLGVITVDDVLEVTLPDDWRRREAAQPPDGHRGEPPEPR